MRFSFIALLALTACTGIPLTDLPTRAVPLPTALPPMKNFQPRATSPTVARANKDIARDFLELAFQMESGKQITRLTRFETPITVALAKPGPAQFEADLRALITRLQKETGIDIRLAQTGEAANIVIQTLPRRRLQSTVPQAACFVVPRVTSWQEFRKNRRSGALDWSTLERRETAAVFIPDDVSPQEARDCLHEEIAQAMGPLNDIYRLGDSVFNDDNMNTVLTGFDMLILKAYYDPALKNGMTKTEVAAVLPAVLDRLNPTGANAPGDGIKISPRNWVETIETALGPRIGQARRLQQAEKALAIARQAGWMDNRLGFNLFARGRLALGIDGELSADSFTRAYNVYSELYGVDDIHTANVALQLAAFSLSTGDSETALALINNSLPAVARAENATLLATLLMVKAEALDSVGKSEQAATVRLDSLGWARYGFASDKEVRARLQEIAALRPRKKKPEV